MPQNPALKVPRLAAPSGVAVLTKVRVVLISVSGHLGVSTASDPFRDCLRCALACSLGLANGCTPAPGPKGEIVGIGRGEEAH